MAPVQTALFGVPESDTVLPQWFIKELGKQADELLWNVMLNCIEAITGDKPSPSRCKGAGQATASLFKHVKDDYHGSFSAFSIDLLLVANASQNCQYPLFKNDIRGIRPDGSIWGVDRSKSPETVCRVTKWNDRLSEARRWKLAGFPSDENSQPAKIRAGSNRTAISRLQQQTEVEDF